MTKITVALAKYSMLNDVVFWIFFYSVKLVCVPDWQLDMNKVKVVALFGNWLATLTIKITKDCHTYSELVVDMITCCQNSSKILLAFFLSLSLSRFNFLINFNLSNKTKQKAGSQSRCHSSESKH